MEIDWSEFKNHKQYSVRTDRLEMVLEFMKSYYNMSNPSDIYEALKEDDIGAMLLEKKAIKDAEALEEVLFKM